MAAGLAAFQVQKEPLAFTGAFFFYFLSLFFFFNISPETCIILLSSAEKYPHVHNILELLCSIC